MYQKRCISVFVLLFIFVIHAETLINRTCITPNNETSSCASIFECKVFINALKTGDKSQQKYIKESLCGFFRDVPIVCCGSDANYLTPNQRLKRNTQFNKNPEIPESDCGKPVGNKGTGHLVNNHDFPWAVRLGYNKTQVFPCEGTLISKRYVLTSGLCLGSKNFNRIGSLSKIRLGIHNCPEGNDKCKQDNYIDVGVEETILHKDYGHDKKVNHDDIGLIRLDRDITFNDEIAPICLPKPTETAKDGDEVIEVGWYKNSPEKLQSLLTVVGKKECSDRYAKINQKLSNTHMCAGGTAEGCAGSSGGSLIRKDQNSWVLEGIISFGPLICEVQSIPNVYTEVEKYLQWIHDNVKK